MNARDGKRILIVDDSDSIRRMVSYLLERAGYTSLEATDGEQAIGSLVTDHADLVLLDLNMPVMDGFETLRRLRQDPALADTRVIVMTTEESENEQKLARQMGVLEYVVKPFQPGDLLKVVEKYIGTEAHDAKR